MRVVLVLALLGWGAFLYWGRNRAADDAVGCSAVQDLPANHRLNAADLSCTPSAASYLFAGAYLKENVSANRRVALEKLADGPVVRLPADRALVAVAVDGGTALPEPGSKTAVSAAGKTAAQDALVLAVVCPGRADQSCIALLGVSAAQVKELTSVPPLQVHLGSAPPAAPAPPAPPKKETPKNRVKQADGKPEEGRKQ